MRVGSLVNRDLARTLLTLLWAVVTGVLIVITPIPINLILLAAWIYLLRRSTRIRRKAEPAKSSWPADDELDWVPAPARAGITRTRALIAIQLAIVATIIVVAGYLPIKQIDQCMNREITLPKTEMTLGELSELRSNGHVHPLYLELEPEHEPLVVHFPRTRMRLGEVMTTIEQQAKFRRVISSCGTGATILWGSCPMYIMMRPVDPPADRDSRRSLAQASAVEAPGPLPQSASDRPALSPPAYETQHTAHTDATLERAR